MSVCVRDVVLTRFFIAHSQEIVINLKVFVGHVVIVPLAQFNRGVEGGLYSIR